MTKHHWTFQVKEMTVKVNRQVNEVLQTLKKNMKYFFCTAVHIKEVHVQNFLPSLDVIGHFKGLAIKN